MSNNKTNSNRKLIFLIFSFFLLINLASTGGHFDEEDGVQIFLLAESMALKHSIKLHSSLNPDLPSIRKLSYNNTMPYNLVDPYWPTDKATYVARSHLLAAIAVPFYYAALIFSVSPITVVALFVNSMIISLTSVVIFCFSLELYRSKKISFVLSLIFGVCSFILQYNNSFETNPLQGLCIITGAFFLYVSAKRDYNKKIYFAVLGGLFLGLSVFAHPGSIIVIPGFIVYSIFLMKFRKRDISSFILPLAIILIFAGLFNYWRFGSFTQFGFGDWQGLAIHSGWDGLVGLILSPGYGIIFYFPIIVLLPLAFKYMYTQNRGIFFLFAYVMFVTWLVVGTISAEEPSGWNGEQWGPRYLISLLPFITIISGTLFLNLRKVNYKGRVILKIFIITLCIAGFYVSLVGKLTWYVYGESWLFTLDEIRWIYSVKPPSPDVAGLLITWTPSYSPIVLQTEALATNYPSHIKLTHVFMNSYYRYGNAPCSYDVYFLCKFGVLPILVLSATIAGIAMLIVAEICDLGPVLLLKNFQQKIKSFVTTIYYRFLGPS